MVRKNKMRIATEKIIDTLKPFSDEQAARVLAAAWVMGTASKQQLRKVLAIVTEPRGSDR